MYTISRTFVKLFDTFTNVIFGHFQPFLKRSEKCTFTNALILELSSFELRTYPLLSKKISNKSKVRKINNRFAEIENILKNIRDINETDNPNTIDNNYFENIRRFEEIKKIYKR